MRPLSFARCHRRRRVADPEQSTSGVSGQRPDVAKRSERGGAVDPSPSIIRVAVPMDLCSAPARPVSEGRISCARRVLRCRILRAGAVVAKRIPSGAQRRPLLIGR